MGVWVSITSVLSYRQLTRFLGLFSLLLHGNRRKTGFLLSALHYTQLNATEPHLSVENVNTVMNAV